MTEVTSPDHPAGAILSRGSTGPLRLLSDELVARRAAKGDRHALGEIYRRYHQDLYRFCLAMVGNPQDAQDALQNTMVKLVKALPGEKRRIQLKPWIYRIARNEAVEVLRRRREGVDTEFEPATAEEHVAETAEARERLRGLIADLEQLPERQRAALVMREMAGVDFEQIGESFGTSSAVARQTVYEARLSLRQMEAGREMGCEEVTRALSDADGRVSRRRDIRAHLRACESCRAFRDGIAERRGNFAAIAPLPLAASAGLLQGIFGGSVGGAVAASTIAKSAATVAIIAAVGIAAADRGGLVNVPLPGGKAVAPLDAGQAGGSSQNPAAVKTQPRSQAAAGGLPAEGTGGAAGPDRNEALDRRDSNAVGRGEDRPVGETTAGESPTSASSSGQGGHGRHHGKPEDLPTAAQHGQETAAAHKAPQAAASPGPPSDPPGKDPGDVSDGKSKAAPPPSSPAAGSVPPGESAPSAQGPEGKPSKP